MTSQVEAVVLAAGLSSRCPPYKLALPLGDKTVIEQCILQMYDIVHRIIVVTGWQADVIRQLLSPYDKVVLAHNSHFRDGMLSSVKTGVASVRAPAFFLIPGDYALVSRNVYAQMLTTPGNIVVPTCRGEKGHPVLFRNNLASEILGLPEKATLRDLIASRGCTEIQVEDEGILLDIDTQQDYENVRTRYALSRCQQL